MLRASLRLVCVLLLAALSGLHASSFTWNGTPGPNGGDFSVGANWVNGTAPVSGSDDLVFTSGHRSDVALSTAFTANLISFTGTPDNTAYYNLGGSTTLTITGGVSADYASISFDSDLAVSLSAAQTWDLCADSTITLNGSITGSGLLTKTGGGALYLMGDSSGLTGGVTVAAGSLRVGTSDALGTTGTVTVESGAALASQSGGGSTIATTVVLKDGAALGDSAGMSYSDLTFTGTVTVGSGTTDARLNLSPESQSYFAGAFNGSVAGTNVTFSGGGVAVLKGTTTNISSLIADGAALIVSSAAAVTSSSLSATGGGYLGMGDDFVGATGAADFIAKVSSPGTFVGTLGFDSDPAAGPNIFVGPINLSGFTNAGFTGLGSASHANITGAIMLPGGATAYKFGGGGGRLTVGSGLTGAVGLTVNSPATAPLTLVLTGANDFTEDISVTHSYLIFDSAGALPAGASISLGEAGYVSATPNFAITPNTLLGRVSSQPASVVGFDSSQPASNDLTIADNISLGTFSGFLGTTTFGGTGLTLSGTITGPASTTLKLAGLNNGRLNVTSPLLTGNSISSVIVGHPDAEMGRNGTVVLAGDNDYTGGTTLLRGTLILGSSATDATSGPIGAGSGALTVDTYDESAPYQTAGSLLPGLATVTLFNNLIFEANSYLEIGRPDQGTATLILKGAMSDSGDSTLVFRGPTLTELWGSSTRTGNTRIENTTVNVQHNLGLRSGTLFLDNGAAAFGSTVTSPTIGSLSGTTGSEIVFGADNPTLTIDQSFDGKYSGTFVGSGISLVKTGSARLWLTESSTSGDVTVTAGTLALGDNGHTTNTGRAHIGTEGGQNGYVNVLAGSTWFPGDWVKVGAATSANGFLSIASGAGLQTSGQVYIGHASSSTGTVEVMGSGATLSAASLVMADGTGATGTLLIGNGGAVSISGLAEIREGATVVVSGDDGISPSSFSAGTLTNEGSLNFQNDAIDMSFNTDVSGAGDFIKSGSGKLILSGDNSGFSGLIRINEGNVTFASNDAAGTGGIWFTEQSGLSANFITAAPVIGGLGGGMGGTTVNVAGAQLTIVPTEESLFDVSPFPGTITGGAALVIQGSGSANPVYAAFSGNNSYTGGTQITNGAVFVAGSSDALGTTGAVTVSGGATLAVDSDVTLTFNGSNRTLSIAGGGLGGTGTFTFNGVPITIGAGATLSPGLMEPGVLNFALVGGATLTFDSGGTYYWRLQDSSSTTLWSSVDITTGALNITATAGAPFNLKLATFNSELGPDIAYNFDETEAASWTLLTATSITGFDAGKFSIDASAFQNAPYDGLFVVSLEGNSLMLNFTPVPEPSTWALLITGLAVTGVSAIRRRLRR